MAQKRLLFLGTVGRELKAGATVALAVRRHYAPGLAGEHTAKPTHGSLQPRTARRRPTVSHAHTTAGLSGLQHRLFPTLALLSLAKPRHFFERQGGGGAGAKIRFLAPCTARCSPGDRAAGQKPERGSKLPDARAAPASPVLCVGPGLPRAPRHPARTPAVAGRGGSAGGWGLGPLRSSISRFEC